MDKIPEYWVVAAGCCSRAYAWLRSVKASKMYWTSIKLAGNRTEERGVRGHARAAICSPIHQRDKHLVTAAHTKIRLYTHNAEPNDVICRRTFSLPKVDPVSVIKWLWLSRVSRFLHPWKLLVCIMISSQYECHQYISMPPSHLEGLRAKNSSHSNWKRKKIFSFKNSNKRNIHIGFICSGCPEWWCFFRGV